MDTSFENEITPPALPTFVEAWLTMAEAYRGVELEIPPRSVPRDWDL